MELMMQDLLADRFAEVVLLLIGFTT